MGLLIRTILLGCAVTFCFSCVSEPSVLEADTAGVSLKISVHNASVDPDNQTSSLRMLVFDAADETLVLNTAFVPDEVYDAITSSYVLSGKLKNVPKIKLFVIANERAEWSLNKGITYAELKALKATYAQAKLLDVEPPFLMLMGEEEITTTPGTSITKDLVLERNVVKVTFNLKQTLIKPNSAEGILTINQLYIDRVPTYGFLMPKQVYPSTDDYAQTAAHHFDPADFTLDHTSSTLKESLVLYIPEHLLTDQANYSRILISASRSLGGEEVTYEIPLGKGVSRLYDATSPVAIADLTASELSCVRNTHFIIDATLSPHKVDVALGVKEWTVQEIEGEVNDAPYLNISLLEQRMYSFGFQFDEFDDIIFDSEGYPLLETNPDVVTYLVWTNLPKEELILDPDILIDSYGDELIPMKERFFFDWVVTETTDGLPSGVSITTGKLTLKPKYSPYGGMGTYTMKVSARNLSRTFQLIVPLNPAG